jgi:peptidoglycan-associated lipoprotein
MRDERCSLVVGIAAAVLLTVPVFAQVNKWYDPYQKGLNAFQASNWARAATLLEQAIAADPRATAHKYVEGVFRIDYFPYYYLGAAYLELHEYEKAEQSLKKAKASLSRELIPKLTALQARLDREKPATVLAGGNPQVPQAGTAPSGPPLSASGAARAPTPAAASPAPSRASEDELFVRKSVEELNAERPLDDVFFDLGQSEIRRNGKTLLQKNADWLKRWTSTRITLEGHSDSRGSSEYNLALGSRRAEAVKDYLVGLGVPASRIVVVSKGKQQPFCSDKNESCWEENRRVHFFIAAK